jgi:hypothetical protein
MNRKLVLADEAARHPFRQSLPRPEPVVAPDESLTDLAFFAISFVSGFIIFFGMII